MGEIEYKANSHKSKELQQNAPEEKRVSKVVNGAVRTKKKNEIGKLADVFISEDVSKVKSYVLMDVLIPAVKKAISDIVTNGIDMILYGESGRTKKRSNVDYVSYRSYSDRRDEPRYESGRSRERFHYDDLVFDNRGEAEAVRMEMIHCLKKYGIVTVQDLYDIADVTAPYTSNKFGWTSLEGVEPVRLRDGGYILKLPRAMAID
jgi:hypothetical protein